MTNNTISVIIPTYNRDNTLIRAIKSVYKQTFQPLEIIVVDDNSDFDVSKLLKNYSSVTVIRNSKNLGAAESRNIGARQAKGAYVAFLDSDDFWNPLKLERQIETASANPGAGLIYCDQWNVDREGKLRESGKELWDKDIWDHLLDGWTTPNTSILLIKKDVFNELKGFDSKLTSCQDHDFWLRLAKIGYKVRYSDEKLSYFTFSSPNRISFNYDSRVNGSIKFLKKWEKDIIRERGLKHYKRFKNNYLINIYISFFINEVRHKRLLNAIDIYIKHLVFNYLFYKKVFSMFHSKLKKKVSAKKFHL